MSIKKFIYRLLLFTPLLNAISDSFIYYMGSDSFHVGIIRFGVIISVFFTFILHYRIANILPNRLILLFAVYLIFLVPLSSDPGHSFIDGYLKWIPPFLLYPVAFYFFKTEKQILILSKISLISALPIILNYIIAQFFSLGISVYAEDSFYYGGASFGVANLLSISIIFSPIFFEFEKGRLQRFIAIVIVSMSVIAILLVMKRTAIISLAIGILTYYYYMPNKKKDLKFIILFLFVGFLAVNIFSSIFLPRYEARNLENRPIQEEDRYSEIFYSIDEFSEGNIKHKLIGSEVFNSKQFFGLKYFGRNRMIHGDFTKIFHGSGLIGFSIFLYLLFSLYSFNKVINNKSPLAITNRLFFSIFNGLLFCFIFMTATGVGISVRSLIFLMLGALNGIMVENVKKPQAKVQ